MQNQFIVLLLGLPLLLGLGCQSGGSQDAQSSDGKHREQVQPEEPLTVQIGEKTASAPAAVLAVRFFSDGSKEVQLEFQVSDGEAKASLVAVAGYGLIEDQRAELLLSDAAKGERVNLVVDRTGQKTGTLQVALSEGGQISGNVEGGEEAIAFFGKFVLLCSVPPAGALEDDAVEAPTPESDGAGEVLVVDTEFRSEQCQQAKQLLKL